MSDRPGGEGAWLVSTSWLNENRQVRDAVQYNLGFGIATPVSRPRDAMWCDSQLMLTQPEGIKGMKYTDPVIYGEDCYCLEVVDSANMVDAITKKQRRTQYVKTQGGDKVKEFVLNASINPVPGNTVISVARGVGGELFVVGNEWELPCVVKTTFKEAKKYSEPVKAHVHILAATGDIEDSDPTTQTYVVTDYELTAVVRGKGLGLSKGTPGRVKTVCGVWMFSWSDCSPDTDLKGQLDTPVPYPDRFDPGE